jgi:hypothetical protein
VNWKPSRDHFRWSLSLPFIHDDTANADYYLEYNTITRTQYIVFQSTRDKRDWIHNFLFFPVLFRKRIFVHFGHLRQYKSIRDKIITAITANVPVKIRVCGYSLGGSLAKICVDDLKTIFPDSDIHGISYEGSKPFWMGFGAKWRLRNCFVSVKTFWDPVIWAPFLNWGFMDVGKSVWIGSLKKIKPCQHYSDEIEKNLYGKFGE